MSWLSDWAWRLVGSLLSSRSDLKRTNIPEGEGSVGADAAPAGGRAAEDPSLACSPLWTSGRPRGQRLLARSRLDDTDC